MFAVGSQFLEIRDPYLHTSFNYLQEVIVDQTALIQEVKLLDLRPRSPSNLLCGSEPAN